jgi:hypothetical protein
MGQHVAIQNIAGLWETLPEKNNRDDKKGTGQWAQTGQSARSFKLNGQTQTDAKATFPYWNRVIHMLPQTDALETGRDTHSDTICQNKTKPSSADVIDRVCIDSPWRRRIQGLMRSVWRDQCGNGHDAGTKKIRLSGDYHGCGREIAGRQVYRPFCLKKADGCDGQDRRGSHLVS